MKSVRLLQPAEREMLNAARYYEDQATDLGQEFLQKLESVFAVLFRQSRALAFAHLRRRPDYWTER